MNLYDQDTLNLIPTSILGDFAYTIAVVCSVCKMTNEFANDWTRLNGTL